MYSLISLKKKKKKKEKGSALKQSIPAKLLVFFFFFTQRLFYCLARLWRTCWSRTSSYYCLISLKRVYLSSVK